MKRMVRAFVAAAIAIAHPIVAAAADGSVVTIAGSVLVPRSLVQAGAEPPVVELLVEPSWEVQHAAELAGTPVSMSIVARQSATPSFTLPLDLGALDPRFVAAEGYVNVLVVARYGDRVTSWGTTVWPGDSLVQVPALDMSKGVVPPGGGAGSLWVEPQAPTCLQIVWGDYNGPYDTKIMDVMNASNIPSTATYAYGGSTSTTLGYLTNGPNWQVGGTMTVGTGSSTGFVAHPTNARIQALWMYRERAVICVGNQNVPYNYYGRGSTPSITHVKYSNCGGYYYPGEQYFHEYNSNQTYSAGLTVYGISLSSKAGYSSTARLEFTFQVRGKVCGSSKTLGEASPKVDARAM
ncbi:MAG: hypothetical protein KatS3mg014_2749 [Actinomycetota bacterium]|nr:MAG: hypothetical protein KatS3mg014_2749 [Actinomycetota bacterium]